MESSGKTNSGQSSVPRRLAGLAALAGAVLLIGAALAHFSMTMHPRFLYLPEAVESQRAILERRLFVFEGQPLDYPSWRNRLAVPHAIRTLSALTGKTFSQSYVAVRWLTACAGLAAFALLVHRALRTGGWFSVAAAACFGLTLLPTFLHIYEIPSDFLDAAFFSLLILCALERRRVAFAVVLLIGLFNRESAVFATFVWFALHAWPFSRKTFARETAFCLIVGMAGTALVLWLRLANAVQAEPGLGVALQRWNPVGLMQVHLRMIREYLAHPIFGHALFFHFGYLAFLSLITATYWRRLTERWRRLGLAGLGIYLLSLFYGNIDELRIFIPSLVISMLLLTALARAEFAPAAPSGQTV